MKKLLVRWLLRYIKSDIAEYVEYEKNSIKRVLQNEVTNGSLSEHIRRIVNNQIELSRYIKDTIQSKLDNSSQYIVENLSKNNYFIQEVINEINKRQLK